MFFCDPCAAREAWPTSLLSRSHGRCEICGKTADCSDIPSSALPVPTYRPTPRKAIMTTPTPKLEIHYTSGEWAALYVDGALDRIGDTYNTEARAFELAGVTTVQDDACLRGGDGMDRGDGRAPARTLDEVAAYRTLREQRREEADRLDAHAKELAEKAAELRRLDWP